MAHPDFANRPSAIVSNDRWVSSRRWEQTSKFVSGEDRIAAADLCPSWLYDDPDQNISCLRPAVTLICLRGQR